MKKLSILISVFILVITNTLNSQIALIVNKSLYPYIQQSLGTYINDVLAFQSKDIYINTSFDETNTIHELKSHISYLYGAHKIDGVVFVGDLPIAEYEIEDDYNAYGYTRFPIDYFYMDVDGVWSDNVRNGGWNNQAATGVFDSHTGNTDMEIWVSRVSSSILSDYDSEVNIVNDYFYRIHLRMVGQNSSAHRELVIGNINEWPSFKYNEPNLSSLLGYNTSEVATYYRPQDTKDNWTAAIQHGYEYGFMFEHSSTTSHELNNEYFTSTDYINMKNDPEGISNILFYNLFACNTARYTAKNCLGSLYAYTHNGLIVMGTTKTGSMLNFEEYNTPLGNAETFGESFRIWSNKVGINNKFWHYGMTLLGAGNIMLKNPRKTSLHTYQAENQTIVSPSIFEQTNWGYNGNGYVNFSKTSLLEFNDIYGGAGGESVLTVRYALGNTDRTGNIIVNGVSQSFTMTSTNTWQTYKTKNTLITLNPGYSNTIRFESTGADFGNLDEISIMCDRPETYRLTVTDGTGDGIYETGTTVTVSAETKQEQGFYKWTGNTAYVDDVNSSTTTIDIINGDVTIMATYKPLYRLRVGGGTGSGYYTEGEVINIEAQLEPGIVFIEWTGDAGYINDVTKMTTTVTMPAQDIYVSPRVTLVDINDLTVINGSGSGSYEINTEVPISANQTAPDYVFTYWSGNTSFIDDIYEANTFLTMPSMDISVTANFSKSYNLTVNNGSGGGEYISGEIINIVADDPVDGMTFNNWVGNTTYVDDVNASTTTVTMPADNINISASYKQISGNTIVYQAEDAVIGGGTLIESNHSGYNGSGFTNFPGSGGYVEFQNIDGGSGSLSTLTVRWASGKTIGRTGVVFINGASQSFTMDPTGGWDVWDTKDLNITLNSGTNNTIRFESNGEDFGNFDEISITNEASESWTVILYDDFENGFGNYTDGGADCKFYTGETFAHQGNNAVNLEDNNGDISSLILTDGINLTQASDLKIDFWYYPLSMDNSNEDFWVQYFDGTDWITIATYAATIDFVNDYFYNSEIIINNSSYNFTNNAKIRFVCDASGGGDDIYIDEVEISTKGGIITNYTLTVNNGSGSGSYASGVSINIYSNSPQDGFVFEKWTGNISNIADIYASNTSINMPAQNTSITASYKTEVVIFSANINFQPSGFNTPSGYFGDEGAIYGNRGNGYNYGWVGSTNTNTRDRGTPADDRYATLNHMEKSGERSWEIEVPNGNYDIFLVCGDGKYSDQINNIDIEGTTITDTDGADNIDEFTITNISVTDGKLTIKPASYSDNAKICFVDIITSGQNKSFGSYNSLAYLNIDKSIILEQNYPNPLIDYTTINFSLPETSDILLTLSDFTGRQVAIVTKGEFLEGYNSVVYNNNGLQSGLYIYTLFVGDNKYVKRLMIK